MEEIGFGNEEQRRAKPSGTKLIDSIQVIILMRNELLHLKKKLRTD